jgi:hypothetical protein
LFHISLILEDVFVNRQSAIVNNPKVVARRQMVAPGSFARFADLAAGWRRRRLPIDDCRLTVLKLREIFRHIHEK